MIDKTNTPMAKCEGYYCDNCKHEFKKFTDEPCNTCIFKIVIEPTNFELKIFGESS